MNECSYHWWTCCTHYGYGTWAGTRNGCSLAHWWRRYVCCSPSDYASSIDILYTSAVIHVILLWPNTSVTHSVYVFMVMMHVHTCPYHRDIMSNAGTGLRSRSKSVFGVLYGSAEYSLGRTLVFFNSFASTRNYGNERGRKSFTKKKRR